MAKIANLQEVPVDLLKPYGKNAKRHPQEQVEKLKNSIKQFGFISPVLIDGECNVVAGHGRLQAAIELGMDKVPAVCVDGLTEAQRRAYIIADNRLAELGGWDYMTLQDELEELDSMDFDVDLTGFELEIDASDFYEPDGFKGQDFLNLDEKQGHHVECPSCGFVFEP